MRIDPETAERGLCAKACRRSATDVLFSSKESNACDVSDNVLGRNRTCNNYVLSVARLPVAPRAQVLSRLLRPPSAHRGGACSVWLWGRKESNLPARKAPRCYRPLRAPARVRPQNGSCLPCKPAGAWYRYQRRAGLVLPFYTRAEACQAPRRALFDDSSECVDRVGRSCVSQHSHLRYTRLCRCARTQPYTR